MPADLKRIRQAAALAFGVVSVPESSCTGTRERPLAGSVDFDRKARATGVCPVCQGRFRVSDGLLPNHAPGANLETILGRT